MILSRRTTAGATSLTTQLLCSSWPSRSRVGGHPPSQQRAGELDGCLKYRANGKYRAPAHFGGLFAPAEPARAVATGSAEHAAEHCGLEESLCGIATGDAGALPKPQKLDSTSR
eukprot:5327962-Amphidinium_carterae.1